MKREELVKIFLKEKKRLGIREKIDLEVANIKHLGLANISKKKIKISKHLVETNYKEGIRWVIRHELLHIKYKTPYHTMEFFPPERVTETLEKKLAKNSLYLDM